MGLNEALDAIDENDNGVQARRPHHKQATPTNGSGEGARLHITALLGFVFIANILTLIQV